MKLCSHSDHAIQRGKYLYYSVISDKDVTKVQDHTIMRLNLKTGKKKVLADALSCGRVKNITSAMVEYLTTPETVNPNQHLERYYFKDQVSYRVSASTPEDYVPRDKTASLQKKFQKILSHLDAPLAYCCMKEGLFDLGRGKYETGFILYSDLGVKAHGTTLDQISSLLKKHLKDFFGKTEIYLVTEEEAKSYPDHLDTLFCIAQDGTIRYHGGDWGESTPVGKVERVTKVSTDLYMVSYSLQQQNRRTGDSKPLGTFLLTMQKTESSSLGYIIREAIQTT